MRNVKLIFFFISFKNLLKRTQHSLEGIPINRNNCAIGLGLDAGLPDRVSHQSNLSEIITFLVFKNFLCNVILLLLSDKAALSYDVETLAFLALSKYIISRFIVLFLKNITNLFLLIGIDSAQNFDL